MMSQMAGDQPMTDQPSTRVQEALSWVRSSSVAYAVAATLALTLLALGIIVGFSAGPLPTWVRQQATTFIPSLSAVTLQVVLGVLLGGLGLLYLRYGRTTGDDVEFLVEDAAPPETPRNAPRITGDRFERARQQATGEIRLKRIPYAETTPRHDLREEVIRALQTRENCSPKEATRRVEKGAWTDDRVAQAFCSDLIPYPVRIRVLQWARPDIGYEVALSRTATALEQYTERELAIWRETSESDTLLASTHWLETIEAAWRNSWVGRSNAPDENPRPGEPTDNTPRTSPVHETARVRGDD